MSQPTHAPHDRVDLYLAPVVLRLDAWLEAWSDLSERDVRVRIALVTNEEPRELSARKQAFLRAVEHEVELHGWEVDLTIRGLRLHHGANQVVLGLPASLQTFLS